MTDRPRRTAVHSTRLDPIDYPWTPAPAAGVLHDGHFIESTDPDRQLTEVAAAPMEERHTVIAVGSNASPAVMHRKLAAAGVSTTLPMTREEVRDLGVGHSAHVSMPGYVAAAPYATRGVRRTFVALHLDDDQLEAVDATEPNYRRVAVDGVAIYASWWGVLAVDGRPIDLCHQRTLHRTLADVDERFGDLVDAHEGDLAAHLAHDGNDEWRIRWHTMGLTASDGLPGGGVRPPTIP